MAPPKTLGRNAGLKVLLAASMAVAIISAQNVAWKDPKTGLMWSLKDNGSDITQSQALDYCQKLDLAGFKDWRLPEINELEALYDESVTQRPPGKDYDVHVKGGIQLTSCCAWTVTNGAKPGSIWVFYFARGLRHADDASLLRRALCVRRGD